MTVKDLRALIENVDDELCVVTQSYPSNAWANIEKAEVSKTALTLYSEDDHPHPS